eukprot:TRINITY_DN7888_c0_g3_i1.p1 TRINITY_DN7888_c0_g3~~TRINITY_DN7888_c0_g3_i1.p1  ORF type:complete len:177 (-),score=34.08 TRINITY_DN7888_c0_g3_i1:359-889(-)
MPRCILVLVLCLSFVFTQSPCNDWIKDTDESTYESLKNGLAKSSEIPVKAYYFLYHNRCIEATIKRNFEKSTELLMSRFPLTDFEDAASSAINDLRVNLNKWTQLLHAKKTERKEMLVAAPAFQWAQSLNYTFLNVKYSSKMDSPGYLDIKNETVNFSESGMTLSADVERVIGVRL